MNEPVKTQQPPPIHEQKKLKLNKERVRKDVSSVPDRWPDILI